jgi:hypothetical protein
VGDHEGGGVKDSRVRAILSWVNVVVIVGVILWMSAITASTLQTQATVAEFNENQIIYVQQQNDRQLCAQHDILVALRTFMRTLGLPTDNIRVPDTEGIDCDA